jgi:hypothetical protein
VTAMITDMKDTTAGRAFSIVGEKDIFFQTGYWRAICISWVQNLPLDEPEGTTTGANRESSHFSLCTDH